MHQLSFDRWSGCCHMGKKTFSTVRSRFLAYGDIYIIGLNSRCLKKKKKNLQKWGGPPGMLSPKPPWRKGFGCYSVDRHLKKSVK